MKALIQNGRCPDSDSNRHILDVSLESYRHASQLTVSMMI
jgi:hypothetical protein